MTLLQAGDVPRSLKTRLLYHVRVSRHRAVYHPTIPASSNMKPTWEELPNSGHPRNIRVYSPEICWFPGRMTSLVPFASAGFIASTRRPLATSWRLGGPLGEGPKATTHGFFFWPRWCFFLRNIVVMWYFVAALKFDELQTLELTGSCCAGTLSGQATQFHQRW